VITLKQARQEAARDREISSGAFDPEPRCGNCDAYLIHAGEYCSEECRGDAAHAATLPRCKACGNPRGPGFGKYCAQCS
jgi:hypothetical protein